MVLVKVSNIKLNIEENNDCAFEKAAQMAGINTEDIKSKSILKYSIDARKKNSIQKIYTIGFYVDKYKKTRKNVSVITKPEEYTVKLLGKQLLQYRPVVVGFGPAGMFLALLLAEHGYNPIIIERGSKAETRIKKVEEFWNTGELDTNCNVQFGEGGAGTFSDGKLNTGIKDKENRIKFVLDTFVRFGANENITYDSKPHIGTDVLAEVVVNIRKYIESKGGTFYFDTRFTGFTQENNTLSSIDLNDGTTLKTNLCILAIGHSARDTFEMLCENHINMEPKPFALGVRVEHCQSFINKSQYGFEDDRLGAADYKLTYNTKSGRGVYSFCMCPGGYVVNSSSEENRIVVNGMSYSGRDGKNANSAIVVTLRPEDFPYKGPLSGMQLQRTLEEKAYGAGKGNIPIQTYKNYKNNTFDNQFGTVTPAIKGRYTFANLNDIFPKFINSAIKEGMEHFGNKIQGFDNGDCILSAIESRTSSPVRIIRDEYFQSNISGLIPAGEGAGYAGGITSAAIDGMKIFEYIAKTYKPLNNM